MIIPTDMVGLDAATTSPKQREAWPSIRLGSLVRFHSGGTPSKELAHYWGGNIPFVTGADITQASITRQQARAFLSEAGLESGKTAKCEPGAVLLVTRTGVGRVGIAREVMGASQDLTPLVCGDDLLPEYARWFLLGCAGYLKAMSRGATIQGITRGVVAALEIPLPPLAEQQRIVELIDESAALLHLREEADRRTAALVPAIFAELFGDPSTNPKEWPVRPLGQLVRFVGGGTPSRAHPEYFAGTIPWATSKDMKSEYLHDTQEHVTPEAVEKSATRVVPPGSVLVVVKSKILAHSLPVAIADVSVCFGQDLKAIRCGNALRTEYLASVLRASAKQVIAQARGLNTEGLNLEILGSLRTPLPPLPLQQEFARRVNEIRVLEEQQQAAKGRLTALNDTMLQWAFQGEL